MAMQLGAVSSQFPYSFARPGSDGLGIIPPSPSTELEDWVDRMVWYRIIQYHLIFATMSSGTPDDYCHP
jgi:hypothetical protein